MGALSWLTVSINAHHFVTDVLSGRFRASILVLLASLRLANFHHYFVGIPVYGNIVIQNTAPETADADNAFVSAFKQCIIDLSKHVQTVRECSVCFIYWSCIHHVLSSITRKAFYGTLMEAHFHETINSKKMRAH